MRTSSIDIAAREAFASEIRSIAKVIGESSWIEKQSPKKITRDLVVLEKALSTALQVIAGLNLEHKNGQDLEKTYFNWQVVSELVGGLLIHNSFTLKTPLAHIPDAYPTQEIRALRTLRDAAREALKTRSGKRGNNPRNTSKTALAHDVGKNFVFRFRSHFGCYAPVSKTGWVVEAMQSALTVAGSSADASQVLRAAVKNDKKTLNNLPMPNERRKKSASNK